jgi:hypothetical protein
VTNKVLIVYISCLVACYANGTSYPGSVVNSWHAGYPGYTPWGFCYGNGYMWVNYLPCFTKRLPRTGSIVDVVGFLGPAAADMGFENKTRYLYCACFYGGAYVRDTRTGSDVRSLALPPEVSKAMAIDFDEGAPANPVWLADDAAWRLWNLTSTGSLVTSISIPFNNVRGLAVDRDTPGGPYLFAVAGAADPQIYILAYPTGSIINLFPAPITFPWGLTWDGSYLWTTSSTNHFVYQFVAHGYGAIMPASLGKVKALYH